MRKKGIIISLLVAASMAVGLVVQAAPTYTIFQTIIPSLTNTYDVGSSTAIWRKGYFKDLTISGTCTGCGGGGGTNTSSTINGAVGPFSFTTSSDTNLGLGISTSTGALNFAPFWIGTLADGRITSAATWNLRTSTATSTLNGLKSGTYRVVGGTAMNVATSSGPDTVTINNIGVTSLIAGGGIALTSATGSVTISNLNATSSAGGTPAGSDTNIQFNNSGAFGANPNFAWASSTRTLTLAATDLTSSFRGGGRLDIYSGGDGERLTLNTSKGTTSGSFGGELDILTGNASDLGTGQGGFIDMVAGNGTSTGAGGAVNIQTGAGGTGAAGGDLTLLTGSGNAFGKIYLGRYLQGLAVLNTDLLSANRTFNFPNASGTIALTSSVVQSLTAGTGINVSSATGTPTIANIGVTANVAGNGISLDNATGTVTITNKISSTTIDGLFSPFTFATSGPGITITRTGSAFNWQVPTSTASVTGLLAFGDWTTFNNKENALTFTSNLVRSSNTVSVTSTPTFASGTFSGILNGQANVLVGGKLGVGTTSPSFALEVANASGSIFSVFATTTAVTSTLQIGDTGKPACLKLKDTGGAGFTYCTVLTGTLSCSTNSCE